MAISDFDRSSYLNRNHEAHKDKLAHLSIVVQLIDAHDRGAVLPTKNAESFIARLSKLAKSTSTTATGKLRRLLNGS